MKAAAGQKRIDLQCDITSNIEVYCDVKLIEQALINLLYNAIKYTPKDRQVMVGARKANKGDRISLYVEDKGIGIRLEDLGRIFEHFYRVDKGRSRAMGGTVSGLAIVRHIVEAHAEQVKVESRVGEGATFTIGLQQAS